MNEVWNLDPIYKGFDDPCFARDLARLEEALGELKAFADGLDTADPAQGLRRGLALQETLCEYVMKLAGFAELKQAYPDLPHYPAPAGQVKLPAGWLIDRCGWKGRVLGRAGVHPRQALVLVNLGGATGADILRLAAAVQTSVRERFGIDLCPEVNYI